MKKKVLLIACALVLSSSVAFGMSKRPHKPNNLDILGSNDRHQRVHETTPVPVPEPATLILLGMGLVGVAAYRRMK